MPTTVQLQAATDTGSLLGPLTSSISDTPAPQPGINWQCHSSNPDIPNQGQDEEEALDDTPKEPFCKKQRPMVKALKEAQQEALSKDSEVV